MADQYTINAAIQGDEPDLYSCDDCDGSGFSRIVTGGRQPNGVNFPFVGERKITCDACDGRGEREYSYEELH